MAIQVSILSALEDNYIYFLRDEETNKTAVVDPSEAAPVLIFLDKNKLSLDFVFNTHHHWDHTNGNLSLVDATKCQIVGAKKDSHRIPGINLGLVDGDKFYLGASAMQILEVPGHTSGAVAYFFDSQRILFTGDTLFSLGCGRLFEGTPEEMFSSLNKIKLLPKDTKIYFGHEYTEKNCKFALSLEPANQDLLEFQKALKQTRSKNIPSSPTSLDLELRLNPFLKSNLTDFIKFRELRNTF